jgi:imidazolonepropionase-like amidohydrolase
MVTASPFSSCSGVQTNSASRTKQAGTWVSPTLSIFHQIIAQIADLDAVLHRPAMRYMPAPILSDWLPPNNLYVNRWPLQQIALFHAQYSVMKSLVRGLRDAGVPLLVGTDPMAPCQIPGFSMKDEFEQMAAAGLSPMEVLRAATSNAAQFLGTVRETGTVAPGKVADLILLDANPLEDVDNVFLQDGVILRGRWFPRSELQERLVS